MLKSIFKKCLSPKQKDRLRPFYYRGNERKCPICHSEYRGFLPYGVVRRPEAQCIGCGSLERHRLQWLWFQTNSNLFTDKNLYFLHVAPEECFSNIFKNMHNLNYITCDLYSPKAMIKMDLTDNLFKSNTFDVILCNHVLEHILDDRLAIRELYRVLKPEGWMLTSVPIMAATTFEDRSITSPEERLRVYGQSDHVRRCGDDYKERLKEAGFTVATVDYALNFSEEEKKEFGLIEKEPFYICKK